MGCAVGLERMRLEEGCPVFVCFACMFSGTSSHSNEELMSGSGAQAFRLPGQVPMPRGMKKIENLRLLPVHRELMNHASRRGLRPDLFSPDIRSIEPSESWRPAIWVLGFFATGTIETWLKANGIHVSVVSQALILRIHVIILPYAIYERNNIP